MDENELNDAPIRPAYCPALNYEGISLDLYRHYCHTLGQRPDGMQPAYLYQALAFATLLTLTMTSGSQITNVRNAAHGLDTEAVSTVIDVATASDVDTLDISAIAEYESTAAAGALVLLKLKGLV